MASSMERRRTRADRAQRATSSLLWLVLTVLVGLCGGCNLQNPLPVAEPNWEEQREALLDITPVGTPREDVAARLTEAGVQFTCSGDEPVYTAGMQCSTFYCHRWGLGDGKIWPLDVALLFDESGALYKIRRSSADIALADAADPQAAPPTATTAGATRDANGTDSSGPPMEAADGTRSGPRSSFGAARRP